MSDREAFEAMMRDTFGDAVSLHNDGVMYTDGFVGAVYIGWLKGSLAEAERFKRELEMQAAKAPQPVVPEGYVLVSKSALDGALYLAGLAVTSTDFGSQYRADFKVCCEALLSAGKENNNE